MRQFNVCERARVKQYLKGGDFSEEGKARRAYYVPLLIGKIVVVVDYSDAHGLVYGVIEPNFDGHRGRKDTCPIYWLDPEELEKEV
jgi:hypothetical protein